MYIIYGCQTIDNLIYYWLICVTLYLCKLFFTKTHKWCQKYIKIHVYTGSYQKFTLSPNFIIFHVYFQSGRFLEKLFFDKTQKSCKTLI